MKSSLLVYVNFIVLPYLVFLKKAQYMYVVMIKHGISSMERSENIRYYIRNLNVKSSSTCW